jgi:Ca2+/H+ antiporter
MRLALTRAGIWFFTSILITVFFTNGSMYEGSLLINLLLYLGIGVLCGGLRFCATLYDVAMENRELELKERRKALRK